MNTLPNAFNESPILEKMKKVENKLYLLNKNLFTRSMDYYFIHMDNNIQI